MILHINKALSFSRAGISLIEKRAIPIINDTLLSLRDRNFKKIVWELGYIPSFRSTNYSRV